MGSTKLNTHRDYDIFISHATEDKERFVRPLADALVSRGLRVWYDEFEIRIGDSLRGKIDDGLANSRFGLVIISRYFFQKEWPRYELDGLIAQQMTGRQMILPVWHDITKEEVLEFSPSLANIAAADSQRQSIDQIADEIVTRISAGSAESPSRRIVTVSHTRDSGFAVFYVAPAHTEELAVGQVPEPSLFGLMRQSEAGERRWVSVVAGDSELEYRLEGSRLRLQLDRGNRWAGDEWVADDLMNGDEPFAVVIRHSDGGQTYFPRVANAAPSRSWLTSPNPSGWITFEIR